MRIANVRCILLTSPYGRPHSLETTVCYPNGPFRTTGLVEVSLEDGTIGIGEGYLAVFAPRVFEALIDFLKPVLIGTDGSAIEARLRDVRAAVEYWSFQGAARHALSAVEIALVDAKSKRLELPAVELFGGARTGRIPIYASGGDSTTPKAMSEELDRVEALGARIFKLRARGDEVDRTAWTLTRAHERGIRVGVDMYQNLADPPQSTRDVSRFVEAVHQRTPARIMFLEEPLGVTDETGLGLLRSMVSPEICGGEIVTRPEELARRIERGLYDFVQPDATVIGGIRAVLDVFVTARAHGCGVVVHAWGGAACLMANYHAAFAGGGRWVEYPMLPDALRDAMFSQPLRIDHGQLSAPSSTGLGVTLTPELERTYAFREDAIYRYTPSRMPDRDANWS